MTPHGAKVHRSIGSIGHRGGIRRVDAHATDWIDGVAIGIFDHLGWGVQEFLGACDKSLLAPWGAEVVPLSIVVGYRRRRTGVDLHPTDGVDCDGVVTRCAPPEQEGKSENDDGDDVEP